MLATVSSRYALYKQAIEGDCSGDKSGMMQVVARAKWSAWDQVCSSRPRGSSPVPHVMLTPPLWLCSLASRRQLRGTSQGDAEAQYIKMVHDLAAEHGVGAATSGQDGGSGGLSGGNVSTRVTLR